jgi:integrase
LLDAKLQPLNEGRRSPESTMTVADYGRDYFLPYMERAAMADEKKPSTVHGYKGHWRRYLEPRLKFDGIAMRDFRCCDATNLLAEIHRQHGIGKATLRHCKALLSSVFTYAKRQGVVDGINPVQDAGIPSGAASSKPTYAYSLEEVLLMLAVLEGIAKKAVALMFFCALRPGEACAAKWENYDGKTLRILESMWHGKAGKPKTEKSIGSVPVTEPLRVILEESRRESGYILATETGAAVDLHNLAARVVRVKLALCAECHKEKTDHGANGHVFKPLPTWQGWYALRRAAATFATSDYLAMGQMAAKSMLRHSNVQTTAAYYIKSVPADARRAVEAMDAFFKSGANSIN